MRDSAGRTSADAPTGDSVAMAATGPLGTHTAGIYITGHAPVCPIREKPV